MRNLVGRSMIFLMLVVTGSWFVAGDSEEAFWRAAKTGDVAVVQQQLSYISRSRLLQPTDHQQRGHGLRLPISPHSLQVMC